MEIHGPLFPTPVPDIIEGEEEYEVEGILKHKTLQGKTHFLIRWKEQPTTEDSWEPEGNLTHAKDVVADYWARTEQLIRRKERTKGKLGKHRSQETPLITRIRLLRCGMEAIWKNKNPELSHPFKSKTSTEVRLARLTPAPTADPNRSLRTLLTTLIRSFRMKN
jgi:hypothetical protein